MDYLIHVLIIVNIYIIAAVSLNLVAGYAGMLSLAHAGFFGVGAYVAALSAATLGTGFFTSLSLGVAVVLLVSWVIAVSSARLTGDYFVIATFAFQVVFHSLMNNWVEVTNGPMGLSVPGEPAVFGTEVSTRGGFLALTTAFALAAVFCARRLAGTPFGRVLQAIREDEVFALALGKNVAQFKVSVFVSSAAAVAAAGALYAYYFRYVDPTSFTIQESVLMLAMVIVGGAGRVVGSVVGAVLLVATPEILRLSIASSSTAPHLRQILYGSLLVLFMLFRQQGVAGRAFGQDR